jgi:hypothetical protein
MLMEHPVPESLMQEASPVQPPQSLSEKILRALILGTLAMLGFYLVILRGILKLGMAAIRKS